MDAELRTITMMYGMAGRLRQAAAKRESEYRRRVTDEFEARYRPIECLTETVATARAQSHSQPVAVLKAQWDVAAVVEGLEIAAGGNGVGQNNEPVPVLRLAEGQVPQEHASVWVSAAADGASN